MNCQNGDRNYVQSTQSHIQENSSLHHCLCESLKSSQLLTLLLPFGAITVWPFKFAALCKRLSCCSFSSSVFRTVNYTILQESSVSFRSIFPGHKHFRHVDINSHTTVFCVVDTNVSLKMLSLNMDAACFSEILVSTSETTGDRSEHKLQSLCAKFYVLLKEENYFRREVTA